MTALIIVIVLIIVVAILTGRFFHRCDIDVEKGFADYIIHKQSRGE